MTLSRNRSENTWVDVRTSALHPDRSTMPSVDELKRAWIAVSEGQFREASWTPVEPTVVVVSAAGGVGASTVAVALAEAAGDAVLVDGAGSSESGLIAAGRTELGSANGWVRSARGPVLIVRSTAPASPPPTSDGLTVIDLGGSLARNRLVSTRWLQTAPLVVVATATVPGLRRLEHLLSDPPARFALAIRGERRWAAHMTAYLGPTTKRAVAEGRSVTVPYDPHVALHGLNPDDLPKPLVAAGARLLQLLDLHPSPVSKGLS